MGAQGVRDGSKGRWLGRGEKGRIGDGLGTGSGRERKDGYGYREVYISTKGAILGMARELILEGLPDLRIGPQIFPWAAEERVP